jgi:hypothetical protein
LSFDGKFGSQIKNKPMDLFITGDINRESGVAEVLDEISSPTRRHFTPAEYGGGLVGIAVVLMCRDPRLNFKRRIRFSKKEKVLYIDIMLSLDQMRIASHEHRKRVIVERLLDEIPVVLHRYSIKDFDETRFVEDLGRWLKGLYSPSSGPD